MSRFYPCLLALLTCLAASLAARADHFAIDLEVKAGDVAKTAHTDTAAVGVKAKPRPLLETKAGTALTVKWTLKSTAEKQVFKDVLIHFFAVKEDQVGQPTVPKLNKGVQAETALTMDFKAKDKSEGELSFKITQPGVYLIRLETIGTAVGAEGHEHFAALDLVVK